MKKIITLTGKLTAAAEAAGKRTTAMMEITQHENAKLVGKQLELVGFAARDGINAALAGLPAETELTVTGEPNLDTWNGRNQEQLILTGLTVLSAGEKNDSHDADDGFFSLLTESAVSEDEYDPQPLMTESSYPATDSQPAELPDSFGPPNPPPMHTNSKGELLDVWYGIDWASNMNGIQHDKAVKAAEKRHKDAVSSGKLICLGCEFYAAEKNRFSPNAQWDYPFKGNTPPAGQTVLEYVWNEKPMPADIKARYDASRPAGANHGN